MKSFFKLVLLSLVLVIVALVSALTAMRFAIHGREVAVPKLVAMTPFDAQRTAAAAGLQMAVERQYYSPDVPEGKIMSQLPPPGTKVRRGWQVRVAESLGPQRVAIPDVKGETSRAAEINMQRRGLDLGATATIRTPNSPPDQVLAQSPPPNARGVSAPRISLLVSAAPDPQAFVMPNFVGQPLGGVTAVLRDAGMHLGTVTVAAGGQTPTIPTDNPASPPQTVPASGTPAPAPPPSPSSLILSQNPPAGQKIIPGSTVTFEVSR